MKIIAIGDTHGRTLWKDIVAKHPEADKFVLIGDYFDTHEDIHPLDQLINFNNIIAEKILQPDRFVLLVGNHDHHYWPGVESERYSGYQEKYATTFKGRLNECMDQLQICFQDENGYVYSHAGFTETFVNQRLGSFDEKIVNDIYNRAPNSFNFFVFDRSGCGDDVHQSCIWVRPRSLYADKITPLQIVGHTYVNKINHPAKSERRGFYLIDTLGTSREYLSITDGVIKIEQL